MKKISIEHNFGGGWRIEVPIRDMSAVIAEAIQDSDTLLSVIYVINRTRWKLLNMMIRNVSH